MNLLKYFLTAVALLACGSLACSADELPLPTVPDSIKVPQQRAQYVMLHFWDAMDFSDSKLIDDALFMEQNFVNYLSLLPHAPQDSLQTLVNTFLDKASVDEKSYTTVYDLATTYLNSSDSPMRDEGHYILFLNHAVSKGKLNDADRQRAEFRLEMALKNRPGMKAPDFSVITRDDSRLSFSRTLREGFNIVIFYDPDCGHCEEVMTEIARHPALNQPNVIAIDAEDDQALWTQSFAKLPAEWTVAFALDPIQDDEIYVLPEMPTIYLIDGDGIILLKETSVANIVKFLQ